MASQQKPRPGGTPGRTTKAERREQARRERIEIQRRMERARRNRTIAIVGLVVVGVAVVALVALTPGNDKGGTAASSASGPLPGMMTGAEPWSSNTDDLAGRLSDLSLPPVGGAVHIHSHLDLFVNGSPVAVPADIGISSDAESPLHTHDDTGVIHLESADPNSTFTLGEFFDVWGLRLTSSCVGGYCDSGDRTLQLFVNGKPYDGDVAGLQLANEEEIVMAYGTKDQVPSPLPTFDWSTLNP